ncbi:hypothetical protein [Sporomusa sp.]|uniref:hypothetical protein n=1 Tax=Sporomusa sp. TaxID=2078658 RepID=UPI002BD18E51|nr:hypothetical protein [Sporomusa sp.]HWR06692.1 hypothetical protein [Sporomusa sp.]
MFSPVVREILDNAENSLILKQRTKKMSHQAAISRVIAVNGSTREEKIEFNRKE